MVGKTAEALNLLFIMNKSDSFSRSRRPSLAAVTNTGRYWSSHGIKLYVLCIRRVGSGRIVVIIPNIENPAPLQKTPRNPQRNHKTY